jgi:hypothetical protein
MLGVWAAVIVAMLARKDEQGLWWHERKLGLTATLDGGPRQLARLGAFIVLFQATFLIFNTIPPVALRLVAGGPSLLVP